MWMWVNTQQDQMMIILDSIPRCLFSHARAIVAYGFKAKHRVHKHKPNQLHLSEMNNILRRHSVTTCAPRCFCNVILCSAHARYACNVHIVRFNCQFRHFVYQFELRGWGVSSWTNWFLRQPDVSVSIPFCAVLVHVIGYLFALPTAL